MAAAARVEQFLNRKGLSFELMPVSEDPRGGLEAAVLGFEPCQRRAVEDPQVVKGGAPIKATKHDNLVPN